MRCSNLDCHDGTAATGFTLLEVLVSAVISAIILGIVIQLQMTSWSNSRTTNNRVRATQSIAREIETTRFFIALDTSMYWPPHDSSFNDQITGLPVRRTVTAVNDPWGGSIAKVRQLRYVVDWTAPKRDSVVILTRVSQDF